MTRVAIREIFRPRRTSLRNHKKDQWSRPVDQPQELKTPT